MAQVIRFVKNYRQSFASSQLCHFFLSVYAPVIEHRLMVALSCGVVTCRA